MKLVLPERFKKRLAAWQAMRCVAEHVDELERDNDRLRSLLAEIYPFVGDTCPESCPVRAECEAQENRGTHGQVLQCLAWPYYGDRLRAAGVEVET